MHELLLFGLLFVVLFLAGRTAVMLRLGFVPLYILAGVLMRALAFPEPGHGSETVEFFAVLGMMLLLSFMGLEISTSHLWQQRHVLLRAGGIDLLVNLPVGFALGLLMGGTLLEALFLAGITYISSSAVIAKALMDLKRVANPETEAIIGVLVFEDLFITVYLAVLAGLVHAGQLSVPSVTLATAKAIGFCVVCVVGARLLAKQLDRLLDVQSQELFLLGTFGLILMVAVMAVKLGLSEAIGAFIGGMMIANTAHKHRAEEALAPLQLLFAAIFFVSFGLLIDLAALGSVVGPTLLLLAVTGVAKVASGYLLGRLEGYTPHVAVRIGLSLIARGEFSMVLAGLAGPLRGTLDLLPLTALYVFTSAVAGSLAMTYSEPLSAWLVRQLRLAPRPAVTPERPGALISEEEPSHARGQGS